MLEVDVNKAAELEESVLLNILKHGTVTTLFQPIYDISQQSVLGFEALSRGVDCLEMPHNLFRAADKHNRLSELELLCREKAIERFVAQQLPGKLFLNVSPSTLLDPSHPRGETLQLVEKYGLPANRVVIEVTEQHKVDDGFLLINTVEHYRQLGFCMAIDDLGAGYSGAQAMVRVYAPIMSKWIDTSLTIAIKALLSVNF